MSFAICNWAVVVFVWSKEEDSNLQLEQTKHIKWYKVAQNLDNQMPDSVYTYLGALI